MTLETRTEGSSWGCRWSRRRRRWGGRGRRRRKEEEKRGREELARGGRGGDRAVIDSLSLCVCLFFSFSFSCRVAEEGLAGVEQGKRGRRRERKKEAFPLPFFPSRCSSAGRVPLKYFNRSDLN